MKPGQLSSAQETNSRAGSAELEVQRLGRFTLPHGWNSSMSTVRVVLPGSKPLCRPLVSKRKPPPRGPVRLCTRQRERTYSSEKRDSNVQGCECADGTRRDEL